MARPTCSIQVEVWLPEILTTALGSHIAELLDHFEVVSVVCHKQGADSLDGSCDQHIADDPLLFLRVKSWSLASTSGLQAAQEGIEDFPGLDPIVGGWHKQFAFPFVLLFCGFLLFHICSIDRTGQQFLQNHNRHVKAVRKGLRLISNPDVGVEYDGSH